jgi:hypothetical protein
MAELLIDTEQIDIDNSLDVMYELWVEDNIGKRKLKHKFISVEED